MNSCKKIFGAYNKIIPTIRYYSNSALYITGNKANSNFSALTPHLDFDERIKNKAELEKNIELRNIHINLPATESRWEFFQEIDNRKAILELTREEISKRIKNIVKAEKQSDEDKEKLSTLKLHGKTIKDELNVLKDFLYGLEESMAEKVLALPNVLHPKTPHFECEIVHTFGPKPTEKCRHHLDIAKEKTLVEYRDEKTCYLQNDAALFELAASFYFDDRLTKQNFIKFSNPDFARSIVVEGCGTDWQDSTVAFTLQDTDDAHTHELSKLHFTGGASLYSFMAYHTKHRVFPTLLPLRYFSSGRKYQPVCEDKTASLTNLCQNTATEIFIAVADDEQTMNSEFDAVLAQVQSVYEDLGYHFRVALLPAKHLKNYESLHASIQMYSCSLEDYVEVGHLSLCDDYLSKRLLFTYGANANERKFPKVISGCVLNVQSLLSCVIEYNETSPHNDQLLTDALRQHIPE